MGRHNSLNQKTDKTMANKKVRKDKQSPHNSTLKLIKLNNTNPTKIRVCSGALEGLATPAPLVAPVMLLSRQSQYVVAISV